MNYFTDGFDLRRQREDACLSLTELSDLSGISKGSIGNFETGVRGLGRKSQRSVYEALKSSRLQTSASFAKETGDLYMTDSVDDLKKRIAALEAELVQAKEIIHNMSVALAGAGRSRCVPRASGASGGAVRSERKAEA